VPLLRQPTPQQGHLAAYDNVNLLIISDRASNVSRVVRIIERLGESGNEPSEVVPLHNERSLHKGKITLLPGEHQPSIPPIPPERAPLPSIQVPTHGSTVIPPAHQPSTTSASSLSPSTPTTSQTATAT